MAKRGQYHWYIQSKLKNELQRPVDQHMVREYQLDIYSRELERYEVGGIAETEEHFWRSSELVMGYLKRQVEQTDAYLLAIVSARDIIRIFIPDADQQLEFATHTADLFLREFHAPGLRFSLDKKYRELAAQIKEALTDPHFYSSAGISKKAAGMFSQLQTIGARIPQTNEATKNYLRSIIHMHLNRLFTEDQRQQEMATYYLLYKFLKSEQGRSRQKK